MTTKHFRSGILNLEQVKALRGTREQVRGKVRPVVPNWGAFRKF